MRIGLERLFGQVAKKSSYALQITHRWPLELCAFGASDKAQCPPQVIVCSNGDEALLLEESLKFWSPKKDVVRLEAYQPGPYHGSEIPRYQIQNRVRWLGKAMWSPKNTVFLATISGLLQRTLPMGSFLENHIDVQKGQELPEDFLTRLRRLGYVESPLVEDTGSFSNRGYLIDIYPINSNYPARLELFDREVESLRFFDPSNQRTLKEGDAITIGPAREVIQTQGNFHEAEAFFLKSHRSDYKSLSEPLRRRSFDDRFEQALPAFYKDLSLPLEYFDQEPVVVFLDENNIENAALRHFSDQQTLANEELPVHQFFQDFDEWRYKLKKTLSVNKIEFTSNTPQSLETLNALSGSLPLPTSAKTEEKIHHLVALTQDKIGARKVVVSVGSENIKRRISAELQRREISFDSIENYPDFLDLDRNQLPPVLFSTQPTPTSFDWPSESLTVFSEKDMLGRSRTQRDKKTAKSAKTLSFAEINPGDYLIHSLHGVCRFDGLKKMDLGGIEAEFLVLSFKGTDKLFLPIYRIHLVFKFSSEKANPSLDKLGGSRFATTKTKTKKRLREIANELVDLYAKRSSSSRPPFETDSNDISDFFAEFPYQETVDQSQAIQDIVNDLCKPKPMDRLICGDVGFGKTEVAMRAAFIVSSQKKQVAILAPTTVLTLQHYKTLKKRFAQWPLRIEVVNRLSSSLENKKKLQAVAEGEVDIVIGTHRLLSKDVSFQKLGLLICDEEQKFGVKHKEKIRQMKVNVDTLALSATPIPRTLNMSLLGIRDLSFIQTAPVERLETRTFICRYNQEVIRRAVLNETNRGGQVFFLHNRVQSIYGVVDELRTFLPNIRIGVGHGQLKETELEKVMHDFFNGEIDMLVSTTIVESGVDVPNANTILIDGAENYGLSQLYQLRGRVGRSGRRAYCYLLTHSSQITETAKDRLRVIQENTALGSGLAVAQYDLELRGAGTLLGEEQSGAIDNLGYEYFMELMEEAIADAKGVSKEKAVEPEINLRIPAFIPDAFIGNLKLRLAYYRRLSQIQSLNDVADFEEELSDQFGKVPQEVLNLLGIMLIRSVCASLGVIDLSMGRETLVLKFSQDTALSHQKVVRLVQQPNKKYVLAPDMRLKIRHKSMDWEKIYDEILYLQQFATEK